MQDFVGIKAHFNVQDANTIISVAVIEQEAKVQRSEEFAAGVARDVRVIEAITETLFALEIIHLAGMTIDGEDDVLDFSSEILKLKHALRIARAGDEDDAGDEAYEPI